MSEEPQETTAIPLFPLPDVVHFPTTDLRLHIFEPRYRQLVRDLLELEPEARWIGMVLMEPKGEEPAAEDFLRSGTAGRLMDVEYLPDGRSNILLRGEFRFEVREELTGTPYRRALVERVTERTSTRVTLRSSASATPSPSWCRPWRTSSARTSRCPPRTSRAAPAQLPFEHLVNRIAAEIDLPAMAKHNLLVSALPQRAMSLVGILGGRSQALELLRPFRHLAGNHELN